MIMERVRVSKYEIYVYVYMYIYICKRIDAYDRKSSIHASWSSLRGCTSSSFGAYLFVTGDEVSV